MTATQNKKEPTWYEKTVEYAFVREFLNLDAMPLSGTAEKIGDTMFCDGNSFFIVEFKKGGIISPNDLSLNLHTQVTQEQGKYIDISDTISKMAGYNAHSYHYTVYGVYNETDEKFKLAFMRYLHFLNLNKNYCPIELSKFDDKLDKLDNLDDLKIYLQFLIDSKTTNNKSSSVDYGNTLIVDKDGNACSLSDREGLAELNLVFPINKPPQQNLRPPKRKGP